MAYGKDDQWPPRCIHCGCFVSMGRGGADGPDFGSWFDIVPIVVHTDFSMHADGDVSEDFWVEAWCPKHVWAESDSRTAAKWCDDQVNLIRMAAEMI